MIRLEGVELSFGDLTVLSGIDLRVAPGELVGLVGPNGAGKTTLLRSINGILEPDRGSVLLDGTPVSGMEPKEISRTLATVPQDTHVGFSFRAEQLVEMGRTPHRSRLDWSDNEDPVSAALERTETTHLRDRSVHDLSGGERQRILLARALAQEPSGLLLDEPTANLDINHQVNVLSLVAELVAEGRAAIAAIHDLDLAARYCDRLLLLHDGEICARGRPETVLRDAQLATAFDTETAVHRNPVTGTPTVTALADRAGKEGRVHVAGGGQEGATAIRALRDAGYEITAGPVPDGDIVVELCRQLDIEVVTSPPFDEPTGNARTAALDAARSADAIVVTQGPGSEVVRGTVSSTTQVETSLSGSGPGVARVDGGDTDLVTAQGELLDVVAEQMPA